MFRPYMWASFVYYTYSRTQLYFTQQYSRFTTTCFGPICWPFLCITHSVEHNYISPNSTVGIQILVSALYVGFFRLWFNLESNYTRSVECSFRVLGVGWGKEILLFQWCVPSPMAIMHDSFEYIDTNITIDTIYNIPLA